MRSVSDEIENKTSMPSPPTTVNVQGILQSELTASACNCYK